MYIFCKKTLAHLFVNKTAVCLQIATAKIGKAPKNLAEQVLEPSSGVNVLLANLNSKI